MVIDGSPYSIQQSLSWNIPDFRLSPCSECCMHSSGLFPGVWILCADVSEHSVPSSYPYEDGTECSETSEYKFQTSGNYPEESIKHLSWKANRFSPSQKMEPEVSILGLQVPATCPTQSWARPVQSMPAHPNSWRSMLIIHSQLGLGLPSGLIDL